MFASFIATIASFISLLLPTTVLQETFRAEEGLSSWRTNGHVRVVQEGRGIFSEINRAGSPTTYQAGSLEIQVSTNTFAYHILDTKAKPGEIYTAEVWCKAPVGSSFLMFLGSIEDGVSFPTDLRNRIIRDGTGAWESMKLTIEVNQEKEMGLFLYALGGNGYVLYDDLTVQIP